MSTVSPIGRGAASGHRIRVGRGVPRLWAVVAGAMFALVSVQPVWAAKPDWAGNGPPQNGAKGPPDGRRPQVSTPPPAAAPGGVAIAVQLGAYFGERQREAVRAVFGSHVAQGRCPPGLAKKNNGCRPPGLAKAWTLGQPLPAGVTVYPIPRDLRRRLGEPPPGYDFVRVAADILLIAVGTRMVVDAIEDLGGL